MNTKPSPPAAPQVVVEPKLWDGRSVRERPCADLAAAVAWITSDDFALMRGIRTITIRYLDPPPDAGANDRRESRVVTALPNTVIATLAFREAEQHPSKSPGRLVAAAVCEATRRTLTIDQARQAVARYALAPATRDAALALLEQLAHPKGDRVA